MRKYFKTFVLSVLFFPIGLSATPDYVSVATEVGGTPNMIRSGERVPLEVASYLEVGAKIDLAVGDSCKIVMLSSGIEYSVRGPEHLTVTPAKLELASDQVLKINNLSIPAGVVFKPKEQGLEEGTLVMRFTEFGEPINLRYPVSTSVTSNTPVFSWDLVQGAKEYRFILKNDFDETIIDTITKLNRLALESSAEELEYDREYQWTVVADSKGKVYSGSSQFNLPSREKVMRARELMQNDSSRSQLLINALALEEIGFRAEAEKIFTSLEIKR